MNVPTECKFCGCGDIERQSPIMQSLITIFACGTGADTDAGETRWLRDQRCAGPVGRLYKRIRRALEKLKTAKRHDFVVNFMSSMQQRDDGDFVEFDDVEQAVKILEDKSDGQAE